MPTNAGIGGFGASSPVASPSPAAAPSLSASAADDDDDEVLRRIPLAGEYLQLPANTFNEWDRVGQVKNVLRSLRAGYFRDPAILVDQMFEDDRIAGNFTTRCNGLLGSPMQFNPGRENAKGRKVAEACQRSWDQMFPASQVSDLLRWGLMLGVGVAELVWDTSGALWQPRLKVWHPQFIYFRWDTRKYYVMTQDRGLVELPDTGQRINSDGKWVLFTPYGFLVGWMRSCLRALAMPWLIRQWTYRDWARYSEKHGLPITLAIVPSDAEKRAKQQFAQSIANIGNEPVITAPQAQDGDKYDVKLLEATADTYEGFEKLLQMVEKSMAITILGQDSSDKAQGGSLAQAKDRIRDDYRRFDAETVDTLLRNQALYWWSLYNFGDGKLTPNVSHDVLPEEDEKNRLTAVAQLATALPNLQAAGADVRALMEAHGVPTAPDPINQIGAQLVQALKPKGDEPDGDEDKPGSGDGDGDEPDAEQEVDVKQPPAQLALLGDAAPAPRTGPKRYEDRVAASAARAGGKKMRGYLQALRQEIAAARDPEDLRKRLAARFRLAGRPDDLADVIAKARVLARLAGRHDVVDEV